MPRKAKPFLHQGSYYTTRGGKWRKLCPESAGFAAAERILAEHAGESAGRAIGSPEQSSTPTRDKGTGDAPALRFFTGSLPGAVDAYLGHCRTYYRLPDGRTSSEPASIALAFSFLLRVFGDAPVGELSRRHLEAARELMKQSCNRKTCNQHVGRIKRGVRWLAERGLVPDSAAASMMLLAPLPAFRSGVRESAAVQPAALLDVRLTIEELAEPWASIARLQWFTGIRPGEACGLLVASVHFDSTGDAGELDFGLSHKTGYRGTVKRVAFGAQAALALRPWLYTASLFARPFVFRSTWHRASEDRPPTESSYGAAIGEACARAGVPPWTPNQLRHAYATRVRAALGLEAAQNALAHARADVTQVYAERNAALAARAARLLG